MSRTKPDGTVRWAPLEEPGRRVGGKGGGLGVGAGLGVRWGVGG